MRWELFWRIYHFLTVAIDYTVGSLIICANGGFDTGIGRVGWIVMLSIIGGFHLVCFLCYLWHYKEYSFHTWTHAVVKTVFYGGFLDIIFSIGFLSVAFSITEGDEARFLEYLYLYLIAQFPIFVNHFFALVSKH